MINKIRLAIVGATGVVGRTILKVLEEENLPIDEYVLFASRKSRNTKLSFMNKEYSVNELNSNSFDSGFDFAIFSAGADIAKKYAPIANENGCVVIDNSSAFRMDAGVPLVVPEVNSEDINIDCGIIANPNCSTIQAVVILKPLDLKYKIKRIVYSTYQAVSGAGINGIFDLKNGIADYLKKENNKIENDFQNNKNVNNQIENKKNYNIENNLENKKNRNNKIENNLENNKNDNNEFLLDFPNESFPKSYNLKKFDYPIFNNCLPQIDTFLSNGYTKEEMKMINETRKILKHPDLSITATAVRVPVFNSHSESINVEFENDFNINELVKILNDSPGIIIDDFSFSEFSKSELLYPISSFVSGKNDVHIGRIRRDFSVDSGINFWCVGDNIRKGAATNAIQILKKLLEK